MKQTIIHFAAFLMGLIMIVSVAYAQSAGDPCSTAGQIVEVTSSGASSDLICDGGNYVEFRAIETSGRTSYNFNNASATCDGTTEGQLRYDESSDTWEHCNGAAWQILGPVEYDVVCWGRDDVGQASPPAGLKAIAIAASTWNGDGNSCAVLVSGEVTCWGDDTDGQSSPPSGLDAMDVSLGSDFGCALERNGNIECWGNNTNDRATAPAGTYIQHDSGWTGNIGLYDDGTYAYWGWSPSSILNTPPAGMNPVQFSAGQNTICALEGDGSVTCWGQDDYGQATPPVGLKAIAIGIGHQHSCAIKPDRTVECWGRDDDGQATAPAGLSALKVEGSNYATCVIETDHSITCWGNSGYSQTSPPSGYDFYDIEGGHQHYCALVKPQ